MRQGKGGGCTDIVLLSPSLELDGDGWSTPHICCFTPGKNSDTCVTWLCGPVWTGFGEEEHPWSPPELETRTIQAVASRCID